MQHGDGDHLPVAVQSVSDTASCSSVCAPILVVPSSDSFITLLRTPDSSPDRPPMFSPSQARCFQLLSCDSQMPFYASATVRCWGHYVLRLSVCMSVCECIQNLWTCQSLNHSEELCQIAILVHLGTDLNWVYFKVKGQGHDSWPDQIWSKKADAQVLTTVFPSLRFYKF